MVDRFVMKIRIDKEFIMKWSFSLILCLCIYYFMYYPTVTDSFPLGTTVKDVLKVSKHDENCFTQGLVIEGDILYESCGLYGKSSIRKIDLKTFQVLKMRPIPPKYFAEGLTYVNGLLFMLTWKNKVVYIYDPESLKLVGRRLIQTHNGEGWGITTDGRQLIVSDGSEYITFYKIPEVKKDEPISTNLYETNLDNEQSLEKIRSLRIYDPVNTRSVKNINELEYVNGYIFANIWYQDIILQISPDTGRIVERYDLSKIFPTNRRNVNADCLNGIAYNAKDQSFLITGKLWSKYFHINFTKAFEDREYL